MLVEEEVGLRVEGLGSLSVWVEEEDEGVRVRAPTCGLPLPRPATSGQGRPVTGKHALLCTAAWRTRESARERERAREEEEALKLTGDAAVQVRLLPRRRNGGRQALRPRTLP